MSQSRSVASDPSPADVLQMGTGAGAVDGVQVGSPIGTEGPPGSTHGAGPPQLDSAVLRDPPQEGVPRGSRAGVGSDAQITGGSPSMGGVFGSIYDRSGLGEMFNSWGSGAGEQAGDEGEGSSLPYVDMKSSEEVGSDGESVGDPQDASKSVDTASNHEATILLLETKQREALLKKRNDKKAERENKLREAHAQDVENAAAPFAELEEALKKVKQRATN